MRNGLIKFISLQNNCLQSHSVIDKNNLPSVKLLGTCSLNNLCGGTFIDLSDCSLEYGIQTTSAPKKSLDCGSGKIVLNHWATCNNLNERQSLSGYGYISPPTFPSSVGYTCLDATGIEKLPDSVQGFCCGIKKL